jgi:hypothetical protein
MRHQPLPFQAATPHTGSNKGRWSPRSGGVLMGLAAVATSSLLASLPALAQSSYKFTELKQAAPSGEAFAVNNAGQAVGRLTKATGYQIVPPTYRLETTYSVFATVWSATGTPTEVPIPSSQRKIAQSTQGVSDISNSGVVVGFSSPSTTSNALPSKWVNNKVSTLDTRRGSALGINDAGVIVGGVSVSLSPGEWVGRAVMWRNGQATDLHALLALPATTSSSAVAINNRDQVLVTTRPAYGELGPCYVITGSSVQTLAAPPGQGCGGVGLSDAGVVAGNVWNNGAPYGSNPARWINGSMQILPSLPVPPGNFLGGPQVKGINKDGVIVGADQSKPVRWINDVQQVLNTPVSGLPTGATLAGIVNLSDNGKLLVEVYGGSRGRTLGVLTPQP